MNSPKEEYHVMQGSMPDLSTEAGRQLMEQMGAMDDGTTISDDDPHGERGFFDPSDRLYLVEQAQAKREKEIEQRNKELDAVRTFYQDQRNQKQQRHLDMPPLIEKTVDDIQPTVVSVLKKRKERKQTRVKEKKLKTIALVNYASSSESEQEK
ncbi:hypothetical protein THRCLA_08391 [Thraustotheca clavata]|uniref:Uncharacterized protein n=1 Tax=Thraustotheca clavata TaxID=74557 RepID=A0A1V9Z736_9STRA|nr:hypothetical protein THRCLA_08391 [Thraustotheca clavata]